MAKLLIKPLKYSMIFLGGGDYIIILSIPVFLNVNIAKQLQQIWKVKVKLLLQFSLGFSSRSFILRIYYSCKLLGIKSLG